MKQMNTSLSVHRLREVLDYELAHGVFRWKVRTSKKTRVGAVAGGANGHGYTVIRVDKTLYMAHRLAWLYVHGEWPGEFVDHINRVKTDNRISNLRECSAAENAQNQRRERASTSKTLGAHKGYKPGVWRSRLKINGEERHLGTFDSVHAASSAYEAVKAQLHMFDGGRNA